MKLENLAKKYNYICYWCKEKFRLEDLSRDHVVTNHGRVGKAREQGECVLSCIFCNQRRGNKSFHTFKSEAETQKKEWRKINYAIIKKEEKFKNIFKN